MSPVVLRGPNLGKGYFKKVRDKVKKGFIFVISGPSGSGKTTIAKRLLQQPQLKGKLIKPASFTTRPKRQGERQGRDYFFVSKTEFQGLLKAKKILEQTRYLSYDYGTSRSAVQRAIKNGLHAILCLDIKGASFIKQTYPKRAITIFVKIPSLSVAKQRILSRSNKTTAEEVRRRMQLAKKELTHVKRYNYCLLNDNLNKAIREAREIIQWTIYQ
ncbi:MAG: guanylate kinase [Candidatus Omnitrophota bacterium]